MSAAVPDALDADVSEHDAATTLLAVCGAHLAGQPLNPFLMGLGARFVGPSRTSAQYRMVALPSSLVGGDDVLGIPAGTPPRPGLIRRSAGGGSIDVEVYQVPVSTLGALMVTVAPPLAIGTVTLTGGEQILGFVCEGYVAALCPDITDFGSWRDYLTHAASQPATPSETDVIRNGA